MSLIISIQLRILWISLATLTRRSPTTAIVAFTLSIHMMQEVLNVHQRESCDVWGLCKVRRFAIMPQVVAASQFGIISMF